ncbi:MAG TPA: cytochrome c oxidase subunit 4 [Acidimicrobiales bacterium]|nr:cytochrome c oxidase subunit 4 [Acidimicrobiales bacterium]
MKVEWRLFVGGGALMSLNALAYLVLTGEEAGSILLSLSFLALLFVGAYLALLSRRHGLRPQDRAEPEPEDEDADVGYFPSSSIWPFVGACGVVVLAVGLVFGVWLTLFGGLLVGTATLGYALEANAKA